MENIKSAATATKRKISVMGPAGAEEDIARLMLDGHGSIQDCNGVCEALFSVALGTLLRQHVSILLPQLTGFQLLQNGEINPQLRFLCRIGHQFQAVNWRGERFATQLFLNVLENAGQDQLALIIRPVQDSTDDLQGASAEVKAVS
jgi:hypothetical protein